MTNRIFLILSVICVFLITPFSFAEDTPKPKKDRWIPLFNGKNLDGWTVLPEPKKINVTKNNNKNNDNKNDITKIQNQKSEPKTEPKTESKNKPKSEPKTESKPNQKTEPPKKPYVYVEKNSIVLNSITGMNGIKYNGEFPKQDYEICYEAKRTEGSDFFAALTFPAGKNFCTFVNGGWGGSVIGISSINNCDASENETFDTYDFNENEWYKFKIRVTKNKIEVWITGKNGKKNPEEKQVVNLEYNNNDKILSLRMETEEYTPLGFAAWYCSGNLRNITFRKL
ncbi:MAG: DUF1080 domain-containing protein [Planctomycetaceae bacterium]|jgi:hypothetical protein|nr:DUF1080 domain-containing protein [Planctomycetaceae bacterium]